MFMTNESPSAVDVSVAVPWVSIVTLPLSGQLGPDKLSIPACMEKLHSPDVGIADAEYTSGGSVSPGVLGVGVQAASKSAKTSVVANFFILGGVKIYALQPQFRWK